MQIESNQLKEQIKELSAQSLSKDEAYSKAIKANEQELKTQLHVKKDLENEMARISK